MDSERLVETLKLERLEVNLFRGTTPADMPGRIYGGQVIAQSLLAAYETVETKVCHSLHCYFIRPGDPLVPIVFEVDRSRDGGTFATRRVVAIQHGQQIFNLAASFQTPEEGFEHQATMPPSTPWAGLVDDVAAERANTENLSEQTKAWLARPRPIEMRSIDLDRLKADGPKDPETGMWMRARLPIGQDHIMQQAILAYASDMAMITTALRPHNVAWREPGYQLASLDHAMWFHRPTDFNAWHLYHLDSPSASGGRGFTRGAIYAEDGTLVATTAQESLIRKVAPRPPRA